MSDDQLKIWSILISVTVGALLSVIGQAIMHLIQQSTIKKQTHVQKLEELLNIVNDHDNWLGWKESALVFGLDTESKDARPIGKAQVIAATYVSALTQEIQELARLSGSYEALMYKCASERARLNRTGVALTEEYHDKVREDIMAHHRPYVEAKAALFSKASELKL